MINVFWIILSMVKFQYTMIVSTILMSNLLMSLESLIGGCIGIIVFSYIGTYIEKFIVRKFPNRFRKFSKKNRFLVKVRKRFGLTGVVILTPILLGIPIGVLLSLTLTTSKYRIIRPMIASVTIWTSIMYIASILISHLF